jgi:heme-degrading monooxygenase HmoA
VEASRSVHLVDLMAIEETADERLIGAWELVRAFLHSKVGVLSVSLYRSLRPHAHFRFVHVVEVESVDTWRHLIGDPDFPIPEMPLNNHPGLYEVVHQDDLAGGDGVVVMNAFDVPGDADDSSLSEPWRRVHEFMRSRQGHRGARLLRCLGTADYRFVTIVGWEDEDAFAETIQTPTFGELLADIPYDSHTGVYELIRR